MELKAGEYIVLMVVADSCRYDVALRASTPFLDSISRVRRGESPATYTFPAHMSFFIGILPVITDGDRDYISGHEQLWRSSLASTSDRAAAIYFSERTIIEYYENCGYCVVGAGGVSFFSHHENNILPSLFSHFLHFERGSSDVFNSTPRDVSCFPLANIDRIKTEIQPNKPYFLFVNSPATHIPYDAPGFSASPSYEQLISKMYRLSSCKTRKVQACEGLTTEERNLFMGMQAKAMEWIDGGVSMLYNELRNGRPTIVLVLGDHGEEFGEGGRYGHAHSHDTVMQVPVWVGVI